MDTKRPYKSFRYKAKTDWTSARRGTLWPRENHTLSLVARRNSKVSRTFGRPRATRRLGQYMHDVDFSYTRPSERPGSGGI